MNTFYIITSRYVSLAASGLFDQANDFATRFEAETIKDAELTGKDMADTMYPEHVEYEIISETEKMRIDGQPELGFTGL